MWRTEAIANGIGLSVLAAEVIIGLKVVSHLTCHSCTYPDVALGWCGLAVVFLISFSVLSLAAIYFWQDNRFIRTPAHWLGFMAFCGVIVLVVPSWKSWVREGAATGVVIGIASLARSIAMLAVRRPRQGIGS